MLDISKRQILIVGGGAVASRKAAGLLAAGAKQIRVVATEFRSVFSSEIVKRMKLYDPGDMKDVDLVFAATDSSAVNDAVVRDAHAAGILVNRADSSDESPGDFSTPAQFQAGAITVTVSAQSAALAAKIRDDLQTAFNPQWTAMAEAMQMLRPIIKSSVQNDADRATLFRALTTPTARQILHDNGFEGLKNWILSTDPHTF